jgi:hypothetical protein
MPERSDNYVDLVPQHRIKENEFPNDAELAFKDYIADGTTVKDLKYFTNKEQYFMRALKDAYISGWNQHRYVSGKMYTIEEVKEIVN